MDLLNKDQTIVEFGAYIKKARKQKSLSQLEVSQQLDIDRSYYSLIERGNREISLTLALNICRVLGLEFNDFLYSLTRKKPRIRRATKENESSTPV